MLPLESTNAVFPPARAVTLAQAAALAVFGIDAASCNIPEEKGFMAFWILEADPAALARAVEGDVPAFSVFAKSIGRTAAECAAEASRRLAVAFEAFVPCDCAGRETVRVSGVGWHLELAEWAMHEYGLDFEAAANMPLCRLFALNAAARRRNGLNFGGPDYYEREAVKELKIKLAKEKGKV